MREVKYMPVSRGRRGQRTSVVEDARLKLQRAASTLRDQSQRIAAWRGDHAPAETDRLRETCAKLDQAQVLLDQAQETFAGIPFDLPIERDMWVPTRIRKEAHDDNET